MSVYSRWSAPCALLAGLCACESASDPAAAPAAPQTATPAVPGEPSAEVPPSTAGGSASSENYQVEVAVEPSAGPQEIESPNYRLRFSVGSEG